MSIALYFKNSCQLTVFVMSLQPIMPVAIVAMMATIPVHQAYGPGCARCFWTTECYHCVIPFIRHVTIIRTHLAGADSGYYGRWGGQYWGVGWRPCLGILSSSSMQIIFGLISSRTSSIRFVERHVKVTFYNPYGEPTP